MIIYKAMHQMKAVGKDCSLLIYTYMNFAFRNTFCVSIVQSPTANTSQMANRQLQIVVRGVVA